MVAKRKLPCKMSPLLPHDTTQPPPSACDCPPLQKEIKMFRWWCWWRFRIPLKSFCHQFQENSWCCACAWAGILLMGTYYNRGRNGGQGAVKMANKVNNKLNSITLLFGWNIYFVTFANPGRPFKPVVVTWWPGKVSSAQKDFNLSAKNLLLL